MGNQNRWGGYFCHHSYFVFCYIFCPGPWFNSLVDHWRIVYPSTQVIGYCGCHFCQLDWQLGCWTYFSSNASENHQFFISTIHNFFGCFVSPSVFLLTRDKRDPS